jgi:aminotransferase
LGARGRLSARVRGVAQSDIRAMSRACDAAGGVNLGQGICDLPTHPLVQRGAIEAIEASRATYSVYEGIAPLREAIAAKLLAYNRIEADPRSEVLVTVGSTGAFALAMLALVDPGDAVVLFEPFYSYHLNAALLVGGVPRYVTLRGDDFRFDEAELEAAAAGARAIVVCTPSNPCGKVFTRDELAAIARVAERHDLIVITDEIYEYILFDGREHVSPATLPGMRERTVTISGFSKTFSITGWRLGYAVGPAEIIRSMGPLSDLLYVCPPTPLQYGVARGLGVGPEYYAAMRAEYSDLRTVMAEALRSAGLRPILPQGAYYMLADHTDVGRALGWRTARDAANDLLARTGVASIPGSAFYSDPAAGDHLLRFCFAKPRPALEDAARRLATLQR